MTNPLTTITENTELRGTLMRFFAIMGALAVGVWWLSALIYDMRNSIRDVKDTMGSDVKEVKFSVEKIENKVKQIDAAQDVAQRTFVTRMELENWTLKLQLKNNNLQVPTPTPPP